jgi:hypothetical protein
MDEKYLIPEAFDQISPGQRNPLSMAFLHCPVIGATLAGNQSWNSPQVLDELSQLFGPDKLVAREHVLNARKRILDQWSVCHRLIIRIHEAIKKVDWNISILYYDYWLNQIVQVNQLDHLDQLAQQKPCWSWAGSVKGLKFLGIWKRKNSAGCIEAFGKYPKADFTALDMIKAISTKGVHIKLIYDFERIAKEVLKAVGVRDLNGKMELAWSNKLADEALIYLEINCYNKIWYHSRWRCVAVVVQYRHRPQGGDGDDQGVDKVRMTIRRRENMSAAISPRTQK